MSLARKPVYSSHRVVTASYLVDADDRLRPIRPRRCPLTTIDAACKIWWHGWRRRKCGPGYPIALCRCVTHVVTFTVYPPAWPPFGRRPLVDVSAAGHDLAVPVIGVDAWTMTAFGAASDAAANVIWPVTYADRSRWCAEYGRDFYGVARTQRRHVAGINALFALTRDLCGERPAVVAAIGIDLSNIVVAAGRVRDGPELVAEGEKGADILRTLGTPRRRLLSGVIRLGVDRGYWGPPRTDRTMK